MSDRFPPSVPEPSPNPEVEIAAESDPSDGPLPPLRRSIPPTSPDPSAGCSPLPSIVDPPASAQSSSSSPSPSHSSLPPAAPTPPADGLHAAADPDNDSARALLDHLKVLSSHTHGIGAGIYRVNEAEGVAEIVVGIGRRVPPVLDPDALMIPDGGPAYGGRIWHLENSPDSVVLFIGGTSESTPLDLSSHELEELRQHWNGTTDRIDDSSFSGLRPDGFPEMIGNSPKLIESLRLIEKIAATRVSVLILGESGTGKELVGRAIHRLSARTGKFISENCAAIADSLLEGELFGAEKGSFTGAHASRAGLIEEAHNGTLFLDEIGEMGPELQTKLLRVLQEREVRRIGSSVSRPVDFRVISATHRDLDRQVETGKFRADLLFRLDVVRVELPPLRERPGDVPILVKYFLDEIAAAHKLPVPKVEPSALELLEAAPWPGNLRELRNELERAFALCPSRIGARNLSPRLRQQPIALTLTRQIREKIGCNLPHLEKIVFGGVVREILKETGGNKAEAARRLGIAKTNLYRRLDRYGIPYEKRGS